ncbi:MAG: class I SAM-dependent methyltransferase [Terracidiphilus sp.]
MLQVWNPETYSRDAAFVPQLGSGVFEWLSPKAGERILDLGCGDGQLTQRIAAAEATVTGIDTSPTMVSAARARGIVIEQGSAESLPFADHSFDAVFSNAALHWMHDQDAMLAEVRRVLRPGGRFVAEMGGHGNIAAIRVAFAAVLTHLGFADLGERGNYYPTSAAYMRRLTAHGFTVARMIHFPRPTPLGTGGMAAWLNTFCRGALDALPEDLRETAVAKTVALLEPALRDEEGQWTADYVRLRFLATA